MISGHFMQLKMFYQVMQTFLMVVSSLTGLTNQQEFASFNVIKGVELREKSELVSYRLISGNT